MTPEAEQAYLAFVTAHRPRLRRSAALLCGDWHLADDLVQNALLRLYRHWPRVSRRDAPDAWLQRVLLRLYLDERRRPWHRDMPVERVADVATASAPDDDPLATAALRRALLAVPPRQRAVLVLRFYEDLDVAETARLLDCSTGTVKSQTARGLDRLRRELGSAALTPVERP